MKPRGGRRGAKEEEKRSDGVERERESKRENGRKVGLEGIEVTKGE